MFIFDLDGTLIDSIDQIYESLGEASDIFNCERPVKEQVIERIGLPVESLIEPLKLKEQEVGIFVHKFREILNEKITKGNITYEGVEDFLKKARKLNIPLYVATSKPNDLAKTVIEKSILRKYILDYQGIDKFPGKPNPEVILRLIYRNGLKKGIMFGDRVEDALAAKNSGLHFIGVAQTSHSKEMLGQNGALFTFDNFLEMNKNFEKILNLYSRL